MAFRHRPWHILLTILALTSAAVLLVARLGTNGFWLDEVYTLHSIRLGWLEMLLERLDRGHFPGYFVMVRLWYAMWPERMFEVALRSMSVVFYFAAVISFWPLARRVLSGPAFWVALALFACNGVALRQASEARMYTVTLLIAVWITRAWFELQQGSRDEPGGAGDSSGVLSRRWTVALIVFTVLGFVVSATTGVLVGSMILVNLIWRRNADRRLTRPLVLALILGLLVFIPGAIVHVETADRLGISASKPAVFLAHIVTLVPGLQIWDDYYKDDPRAMWLLPVAAVVAFGAIAIIWRRRREMPFALRRAALVAILPLATILLAYPLVELFELDIMGPPRYFLTLMPSAVLCGAWALMQLKRQLLVHAVLTAIIMTSAYLILTIRVEPFRYKVADYLAQRYQPGDGLMVVPNEIADAVELYVPGATVDYAVDRWQLDKDVLRKRLAPLSDRETVWLVWYNGNDTPIIDVAEEMWGAFTSDRPDKLHGGIRVYEFHP